MPMGCDEIKKVDFLVGDPGILEGMAAMPTLAPFCNDVVEFLNDLSKAVMIRGRQYSDVVSCGFWCRRASILMEKNRYDDIGQRIGRGVAFHIAPSNVPVNFAYSLVSGLLAGNANIIRLPSKNFEQVRIICEAINDLLSEKHIKLRGYICLIRYPHDKAINDTLSSICSTRIIWGGDETISEIRRSPLGPRANEIAFADRFSIAVINTDEYLKADDKEIIAESFYNDTYLTDQNACTSPGIMVWLGSQKDAARNLFWKHISEFAKDRYNITPAQTVGKLTAFYHMAALKKVRLVKGEDELAIRIEVQDLDDKIMDFRYNSGFFFEYCAERLSDILPLCTERCQTLTYYGIPKTVISDFIVSQHLPGIDRVVPVGRSMDFSLIWDGYDLIRSMSRRIMTL